MEVSRRARMAGLGVTNPANLGRDIAGQLIESGQVASTHRAAGDVIQAIGQARTPDAATLTQVLATRNPGETVTVTAGRGGQGLTVRSRSASCPMADRQARERCQP